MRPTGRISQEVTGMMHGFGFPLFMGGPLVWLALLVGGFFFLRKVLSPSTHSNRAFDRQSGGVKKAGNVYVESDIYRLAARLEGKVTVSDLVTELGIEPQEAKETLETMTDGLRVRMEVDDDGMIFYAFPELQK